MSNDRVFKKRKQWSGGMFLLNDDHQGLWIDWDGSKIGLETEEGYGFWFSRLAAAELARVFTEFAETGKINTDGYEEFKEKTVVPIDWDSLSPLEKEHMKLKTSYLQYVENIMMQDEETP